MGETVGERIAELRRRLRTPSGKRWTQVDLAAAVGVSKGTVANWETDVQIPSGTNLQALAKALDAPADYIIFGSASDESATFMDDAPPPEGYELNLPDVSFLAPAAREVFDATIGNWMRRKWSTETVERAAVLLLGYFNRTSTLQSSGTYVPELSEEMQIHVLRESREEIENAYRDLGGGPKR